MINNNSFNNATWDKTNSTYKHIIHFANGKSIPGYSRKINHSEKHDKIALLTNLILRMHTDGYLDPKNHKISEILFIEVHQNHTGTHLINLHYGYFEVIDIALSQSDYYKGLLVFLNKFYALVQQGTNPDEIRNRLYVKARSKSSDLLDYLQRRFLDVIALEMFCRDILSRQLRSRGEVEHFARKYCEKHFGGTPNFEI